MTTSPSVARPAVTVRLLHWKRVGASRLGLVVAVLAAVAIGSVGIGDEGHVSLQGDMPRHLMNGVFLLDTLRDYPFSGIDSLFDYARHYYARYPALSLGHHPPLFAFAEVPAFALLGVSVAAAQIVVLLAFVCATALLYGLVQKTYGVAPGLFASALFITSPPIIVLSRSVLAEMITIALVLVAGFFLDRFCAKQTKGSLVAFGGAAVLSLYAKQLAVFVFPMFVFTAATRLGVRRLFRRDLLVTATVVTVLVIPLLALTVSMSWTNVATALGLFGPPMASPAQILNTALTEQFAVPALLLIGLGAVRALWAFRRRDWIPVGWLFCSAVVLAGMLKFAPFEPTRYSIFAVPWLCALAAYGLSELRGRAIRVAAAAVAVVVLAAQGQAAYARAVMPGAEGYEAAAQFVLESDPGATVMFSGDVDTGYFVFFVRKHDAAGRLVVLRSDKVLTTSFMRSSSVEDRIQDPQEIYAILKRFGTRYIVIEDHVSSSRVLEWLRTELRSPAFAERKRIPIGTSDRRLRGVDLVAYEYLDATPPDPEAVLSMNLPVIGRSMSVRLSDLINNRRSP